jgi:hypothetical protein
VPVPFFAGRFTGFFAIFFFLAIFGDLLLSRIEFTPSSSERHFLPRLSGPKVFIVLVNDSQLQRDSANVTPRPFLFVKNNLWSGQAM